MDEPKKEKKPSLLERVKNRAEKFAWGVDLEHCDRKRRCQVYMARFLHVFLNGFSEHRFGLHAAGLTVISLLSLVPMLMLMLLLTKPCGMYEKARSLLVTKTDQAIEQFFEQKGVEKTKLEEVALKLVNKPKSEAKNGESNPKSGAKADSGAGAASGKEFSQQARTLRDQVLSQVDQKINDFNFGLATIVGFLFLAWTVASTFGQVEASMNEIWHVKTSRSRVKKIVLYVGALMVLPFLLVLAMSMPILRTVKNVVDATLGATSYTKWAGDAIVGLVDSSLFSFVITLVFATLALAFVFWAMPHRRVDRRAALKGGLFTALLLMVWIRLCILLQFGIANTSAAFGSFALVPVLFLWTSFNWRIILIGSNMAYAFQCADSGVRDLPDVGK